MDILSEIRRLRAEQKININLNNRNEYRVLLDEEDGVTAYYGSVPLYNAAGKLVLPRWERTETCATCTGVNARVSATENEVILSGTEGQARIIFQTDASIFPTQNGVAVESAGDCSFVAETNLSYPIRANDRCVCWMAEEFAPFLTVGGLYGVRDGKVFPVRFRYEQEGDCRNLVRASCRNAERFLFEIDLYTKKSIFDTTVESGQPDVNNAFGGVAFLGNTQEYGRQYLYSRFDAERFADLAPFLVRRARLFLPLYGGSADSINVYKAEGPWCSFASTWNTKINYAELVCTAVRDEKYLIAEVTQVVKEMLRFNGQKNHGFVVKGEGAGCCAVSTGDNYYRPQILEITLKNN